MQEENKKGCCKSTNSLPVRSLDLNCLPSSVAPSELTEFQETVQNSPGNTETKRKRAAAKDINGIVLEDLVKYFDLPIIEASKNMKIGLTVLKRKCRELGIPRWPHRKIKSLDSMINNLQEEAEQQQQDNKDGAIEVAKRKRMLEKEKKTIEKKPFMEIQTETKRFRQDIFKRRHRARYPKNQGLLLLSDACQIPQT